jgi:hypothetical protein
MLTAISFNDQALFLTYKVSDKWPDRLLAPELRSVQLAIPKY